MRIALDTNVLVYAEGVGDDLRCGKALGLLERLTSTSVIIPAQVLGELFRVLTLKAGRSENETRQTLLTWADSFEVVDSTWSAFQSAFDLATDHGLQIWDALTLSAAAESHCRLLLSEDLQDGFTWRGVTVVNPFAEPANPLLAALT